MIFIRRFCDSISSVRGNDGAHLTHRLRLGSIFACLAVCVSQFVCNANADDFQSSHLVGHETCGECHESELATWLASPHALKSLAMVEPRNRRFNPKAEKIVNAFLAQNANASKQTCMQCHDTQHRQGGELVTLHGVSCESCHGAAGKQGDTPGWVDLHYDCDDKVCDEGENAKEREIKRVSFLEGIGMRHPKNIYGILKACIKCHTVSNENVVNAGHPTGRVGFEYVSWFRDDLEHESDLIENDDEDTSQHQACVKFIVGQLVDLEVSLKNRGTATNRGFATSAATRIAAAQNLLKRVNDAEPLTDIESAIETIDRVHPFLFKSPRGNEHRFLESSARISEIANRLTLRLTDCNIANIENFLPTQPVRFALQERTSESHPEILSNNTHSIAAPNVLGPAVCVRCHQAEYSSWMASSHAQEAFDELRANPNAYVYAKRLGIGMSEITTNSMCANCHATPKHDHNGRQIAVSGISCESCHGAAGGNNGWLNAHSSKSIGYQNLDRSLKQMGMNRSQDIYELAKNCYECHGVNNERLVVLGGHKTGNFDFEWVKWFQGEVRHNFHADQRHNAESPTNLNVESSHDSAESTKRTAAKYIVGQMVDIEISLRNRAKATTAEFSIANADESPQRIRDCKKSTSYST